MMRTTNQIVALMVFIAIGSVPAFAEAFAKGPYLGQTPPGPIAQVFAPGLICDTRPHQGEAWPSFSADGNTFCFNRRRYVYITEKTDQGWTAPKRIESIPYYSVSCCLSPDANSIYVRCVPFSKAKQRRMPWVKGWCMRRCIRTSQGWSLPQELGPPFSSLDGGFSVAADNSIYFWGWKKAKLGGFWVAPFVDNTWSQTIEIPVNVGGNLRGHHPGIAPDESFMVFYSIRPGAQRGTETNLYLALRRPDGTWTKPRDMGPKINTRYFEWGARISPDKKYMFFTRSTGWDLNSSSDTSDIYWVELKEYLPESYR
jgi:WD40-like Beta Propeller Repeat